jgi:hypothetical protein
MTDKEHLCDLHDDNDDFKETKWSRGVGRHPTKRRGKGCANSQDSDLAGFAPVILQVCSVGRLLSSIAGCTLLP